MLWAELKRLEDCEICPLYREELCGGGYVSAPNGEPIEPPCFSFYPDTDVDDWVINYLNSKDEEFRNAEEARIFDEGRKRKRRVVNARRRYIDNYCVCERLELKRLRGELRGIKNSIRLASSIKEVSNIMKLNKQDEYSIFSDTQERISELEKKIVDAELALKAKQAECRKTEYYTNIAEKY